MSRCGWSLVESRGGGGLRDSAVKRVVGSRDVWV